MTFERDKRFYAFGVANGKKEHYCFYTGKKTKKQKKSKKSKKRKNITAKMTLNFLKRLHKKYPKMLLIWDKATNHTARIVQEYIETRDIKQEWFPTACPEENPMEPAWSQLKASTANTFYKNINNYKKAVKNKANKKNLTKMFKYITH
jgi:transposase